MHVNEVLHMMELTVETRKNEIIGKEREHMELKAKADQERHEMLAKASAEREMQLYTRQLKRLRHLRQMDYRREVLAAKIQMEDDRTQNLLDGRKELQKKRSQMRASTSLAKQEITARMEKMRSSTSFEVDEQTRAFVKDPDLLELLERCDEKAGNSNKVSIDTLRLTFKEMQSEGKLSMGGRAGGGGREVESLGRPKSAGSVK